MREGTELGIQEAGLGGSCGWEHAGPHSPGIRTSSQTWPPRSGPPASDPAGAVKQAEVEPKGDLYGEEFHHGDAIAAVGRLRGTPPSGRGRP